MAEESSRGNPGLVEVIVVDARGALKQTSLRANVFQLVKIDRVLTSHSQLTKIVIVRVLIIAW